MWDLDLPTEAEFIQHLNTLTYEDWKPLLEIIEELERSRNFGEQVNPPPENGVYQFPYAVYSPVVLRFIKIAYHIPIVIKFDWGGWRNEFHQLMSNISMHVDSLDILTKCKLITVILRQDRFVEGTLLHYFKNGVLLTILQSLKRDIEARYSAHS